MEPKLEPPSSKPPLGKRIVVIGYGDEHTPSTRFRFHALRPYLEEAGHRLDFVYKDDLLSQADGSWAALEAADILINQKCLLPEHWRRSILALGKPLFFDFDDAIWTRPGKPYSALTQWKVNRRLQGWLSDSSGVWAANFYLADYASDHSDNVHVIPMALDLSEWTPQTNWDTPELAIGWVGSPHNLPLLQAWEPGLTAFYREFPGTFRLFCGKHLDWSVPTEHTPFTPNGEKAFLRNLHVGLLPLPDDPYAKGKSPIKALQYLASGIPTVATIIGATADLLNESNAIALSTLEDLTKALTRLHQDRSLCQQLGEHAALQATTFSLDNSANTLLRLLEKHSSSS